jgi:hypothetical protein
MYEGFFLTIIEIHDCCRYIATRIIIGPYRKTALNIKLISVKCVFSCRSVLIISKPNDNSLVKYKVCVLFVRDQRYKICHHNGTELNVTGSTCGAGTADTAGEPGPAPVYFVGFVRSLAYVQFLQIIVLNILHTL